MNSFFRTTTRTGLRLVLLAGLVVSMMAISGTPAAYAAGITVNTTDANVTFGDTFCTLHEAIANANFDSDITSGDCAAGNGNDAITFSVSGTIMLGPTLLSPIIDGDGLTIDGAGQSVTVSGNNAVRVMEVSYGAILNLNALTIANGNSPENGGGILNNGTLTVTNSTFSDNTASSGGGGIWSYDYGTLTVTNSTFSGNTASFGGGIFNISDSPVTVTNSTFSGNMASNGGGGIWNYGPLNVTNSTFSGNSASSGGGIYNGGTLTVSTGTFFGNSVSGNRGGGIYNDGVLNVTNSTFSGNFGDSGGGIFNNGNGSLSVTNSAFSGNSASASQGGGIENWGPGSVTNSTFFGNSATGRGGGIHNEGYLTVTNSTFSGNSATEGGGAYGLDAPWLPTLTLQNTIVANSLSGGNCSGTIIDGGGNLQYPGMDCGATITSADALLDPAGPQNNGGPTQTIALQSGSPAIDTAVAANCPATDQRGIVRPQGIACDIGAYELEQMADTTAPTITITTPADGAIYLLGQVVIADYACEDEPGGSGLASCVGTVPNSSAIDTASVGAKTFTVDAADNAGNMNSLSASYNVVYSFDGFFPPVHNPPTLNAAKAGQAIALKWRITDASGSPVTNLASATVTAASLACDLGATTDQMGEYASGESGLQNLGDGYYQFNWKTPKSYANSCKTLKLNLGEGLAHEALFRFTK